MKTPCQCKAAGWCPLHKFHVTRKEHEHCRNDQRYFDLFATGTSPQHAREAGRNGVTPAIAGPQGLGDTVANAINYLTRGKLKWCRGCSKRRTWLNRLFPYRNGYLTASFSCWATKPRTSNGSSTKSVLPRQLERPEMR